LFLFIRYEMTNTFCSDIILYKCLLISQLYLLILLLITFMIMIKIIRIIEIVEKTNIIRKALLYI